VRDGFLAHVVSSVEVAHGEALLAGAKLGLRRLRRGFLITLLQGMRVRLAFGSDISCDLPSHIAQLVDLPCEVLVHISNLAVDRVVWVLLEVELLR